MTISNRTSETPSSAQVLILGCGDIGGRVARLEQAEGRTVAALARSHEAAGRLETLGIGVIAGDLDTPASLTALPPHVSTLYYFAPPPSAGDDDPRMHHALSALARPPARLVYISTSGVYGDCGGAWIDEDWPLTPKSARGQRRLAAELALRDWSRRTGAASVILRVPGIYGPGRLPVERIRRRVPVIDPREAPNTNRIHADDLAAACLAAARRGQPGQAYNISDGNPTTMTDYFWRIADVHGLPRPPAIPLAEAREVLSPAMLSFMDESKRLINRRMLDELGVRLRYPDLAQGLPACLAANPMA
jgi:nucleoside-diphosphate-sugar epimerase